MLCDVNKCNMCQNQFKRYKTAFLLLKLSWKLFVKTNNKKQICYLVHSTCNLLGLDFEIYIYIYMFVVVNFNALAEASDFRIERRQVVFLCENLGSQPEAPILHCKVCSRALLFTLSTQSTDFSWGKGILNQGSWNLKAIYQLQQHWGRWNSGIQHRKIAMVNLLQ